MWSSWALLLWHGDYCGCPGSWGLAPDQVGCQVLYHVEADGCWWPGPCLGMAGCVYSKACTDTLVSGPGLMAAAAEFMNSRACCGS